MAHDIHHGGELSLMLGLQGIEAFELSAFGGHIVLPPLADQLSLTGGHGPRSRIVKPDTVASWPGRPPLYVFDIQVEANAEGKHFVEPNPP